MAELFANNAASTLASSILAGDLSLTVAAGEGALFPSPSGGDYFHATLDDGVNIEIVRVTARSSDTLTIVRAQQGTAAAGFGAGTAVQIRLTASALTRFEAVPTIAGMTSFSTGAAAGNRDYYERAGGDPFSGQVNWTAAVLVSSRIEVAGSNDRRLFCTCGEFLTQGCALTYNGATFTFYWYDSGATLRQVASQPTDTLSRTHLVVARFEDGALYLDVNGTFVAFASHATGAYTAGVGFAVGGSVGGAGADNAASELIIHGAAFQLTTITQSETLAWYRACLSARRFVPNPSLHASAEAWAVEGGVNPGTGDWSPADGANDLVRTGSAATIAESTIPLRW